MKQIIYSIIIIGLLSACKTQKNIPQDEAIQYDNTSAFHFIKDAALTKVVDKAIKDDKLVFLDIYTDWCLPCQIMDEEVFSDQRLGDYINDKFVSYKVNAEQGFGPDIATLYNVKAYPTLLFLDHHGRILESKNGIMFHREFREMADRSIETDLNNGSSE